MATKKKQSSGDVEIDMTPMIDVVFMLLIFFLLTFKIVSPEGDFSVKMPKDAPSQGLPPENLTPPIRLTLASTEKGKLKAIGWGLEGQTVWRSDSGDPSPDAIQGGVQALHDKIVNLGKKSASAGGLDFTRPEGDPVQEIKIAADDKLNYRYLVDVLTAISGYTKPDGSIQKMITKISIL